jgi:hypothetical protein
VQEEEREEREGGRERGLALVELAELAALPERAAQAASSLSSSSLQVASGRLCSGLLRKTALLGARPVGASTAAARAATAEGGGLGEGARACSSQGAPGAAEAGRGAWAGLRVGASRVSRWLTKRPMSPLSLRTRCKRAPPKML